MSDLARRVEELEPCPFCGAIPEIHSGKWTISHPRGCYLRYVRSVALKNYLATSESIESWNRRALLAPREEELGLREACEELKRHAQPYEDESGIIKISLGYWADFLSALAVRPVEGDRNGN